MNGTEDTEKKKHKTVPIADSKSYIRVYPRKLTLYKSNASPYFWVRYYADGKIIKRSTKTESKRETIVFAKAFYDEINLRRSQGYSLVQSSSFRSIATAMLKSMEAQVACDELTHQTYTISEYRLKRHYCLTLETEILKRQKYKLLSYQSAGSCGAIPH